MHTQAPLLYAQLRKNNETIAVAESCTGGLLSATLTAIPGISSVYNEGLITYSNASKVKYLNVDFALINDYGVVSEQVAEAMVKGLKRSSQADLCIAITGIAGPEGGSEEKPVGLTYVGILYHDELHVYKKIFNGQNRNENQHLAVIYSIDQALIILMNK